MIVSVNFGTSLFKNAPLSWRTSFMLKLVPAKANIIIPIPELTK